MNNTDCCENVGSHDHPYIMDVAQKQRNKLNENNSGSNGNVDSDGEVANG